MPVKQKGSPPQQNGLVSPVRSPAERREIDLDDPDYIRDLQRPAVIKEDLNEMERRKRVRQILESKAFREELEQLILSEKQYGNDATNNLRALEQLSELILPKSQASRTTFYALGSQVVVPIADLRGSEAAKYSLTERVLRNKLASLYRLVDLFNWTQGINNHITLRLSSDSEAVLLSPYGYLYHEVSASSLVKVDFAGNVLDGGTTGLGINDIEYQLHALIHRGRPDIRCIIHLHTPVVGAVAAMKCGLLPICHEAIVIGPISYHDYKGMDVSDAEERESIVQDLGRNKVLIMRNNGFLACGETVAEAFHLAYLVIMACEIQVMLLQGKGFVVGGESVEEAFHFTYCLMQACEYQVRAARAGIENLVVPSEEVRQKAFENSRGGGQDEEKKQAGSKQGKITWKAGELEWEAWMRVLDNAGFRTGHVYRQPSLRCKVPPPQSEVEEPPAASSYGLLDETDASAAGLKASQIKRDQERLRWINSPTVYQKQELQETGTSEPKTYTKWLPTPTSPSHSTPVKISSPHQFAPLTPNPKEFKDKQKMIKEARRSDAVSPGPKSKVLESVSWPDAAKLKDAEMSGTQEKIIIGAASKGIIEREFQHNAQIFHQLYQPNPFASTTDDEIKEYMKQVGQKPSGPEATEVGRTGGFGDQKSFDTLDGSQSPESVSLMQAAREHHAPAELDESPVGRAGLQLSRETTFEATSEKTTTITTTPVSPTSPSSDKHRRDYASSSGGWFQRSKSERFQRSRARDAPNFPEEKAFSDDETHTVETDKTDEKKEKKKKKFSTPAFLRGKKDKDKKKKHAQILDS